jgi:hypothetical protein
MRVAPTEAAMVKVDGKVRWTVTALADAIADGEGHGRDTLVTACFGSWRPRDGGARCVLRAATGALIRWLMLPSSPMVMLVRRHHGGGVEVVRCSLVVSWWCPGLCRASPVEVLWLLTGAYYSL